ncbi:uncharacterized protein ALTATR162_LOCUS5057 [Alternaria atra]|uniref:Enoyl reductase (ER) domain-containing protein n=1 Tax=Alternaria atra TaxID=119953 RepID=A0A8J2N5R7_9PLEO|nr:uncharacterized protein ALTATR162_LOCUS5057 [Alternaria atra]CAG5158248.1 unnamed protein product [Alternaria atra]
MQAVRHHPPGGPEKLKIVWEDIPEVRDDEILIKIHACSVIWMELYWDIHKRDDGTYRTPILGEDYSGTVVKVGSKVPQHDRGLHFGTEVICFISKAFPTSRSTDGGMAGYAKVHFTHAIPKPRSLSLTEAASIPLSALTAWQGLFDHAKITAGQTVLIPGAAGPTAIWAVQMAKMVGARVIGTASSKESFELLESFGVDRILNYKEVELDSIDEIVDVVFDTVGGDTARKARKLIKNDGLHLYLVSQTGLEMNKEPGPKVDYFIVDMNADQLAKIGDLIDQGKLRPVVDSVFDFKDVAKAFQKGEGGHAHGKILLKGPHA